MGHCPCPSSRLAFGPMAVGVAARSLDPRRGRAYIGAQLPMVRLSLRHLVFAGFAVAACNTVPPRTWVRYQPTALTDWAQGNDGLLVASFHGASVSVDLGRPQTPVEVTVSNTTGAPIEFCMGPDAARPNGPIGQVLLRPATLPGVGGPDYLPYGTMQKVVVEPGWTGRFHLDRPLGREPSLMQFFVLRIEGRDPQGRCEQRTLPLQAINAGIVPATGS